MRRLALKKETLAELTAEDLGQVHGGSGLSCTACVTDGQCISGIVQCVTFRCPTNDCIATLDCG